MISYIIWYHVELITYQCPNINADLANLCYYYDDVTKKLKRLNSPATVCEVYIKASHYWSVVRRINMGPVGSLTKGQ